MNTKDLTALRRKWFLHMCRRVTLDQTVFHGSPTEGMWQIRRDKMLHPQAHGELPGDWLCVSVNDNMLHFFSDGEGNNGFHSSPGPLNLIQLDRMHHALLTRESCDHVTQWKEDRPHEVMLAQRLGYLERQRFGEDYLTKEELDDMLPKDIDGLLFPWAELTPEGDRFYYFCNIYNDECEIALTERGCKKVWAGIEVIYHKGEEYEPEVGWRKMMHGSRSHVMRRKAELCS